MPRGLIGLLTKMGGKLVLWALEQRRGVEWVIHLRLL